VEEVRHFPQGAYPYGTSSIWWCFSQHAVRQPCCSAAARQLPGSKGSLRSKPARPPQGLSTDKHVLDAVSEEASKARTVFVLLDSDHTQASKGGAVAWGTACFAFLTCCCSTKPVMRVPPTAALQ
jgi:hypothetical protein